MHYYNRSFQDVTWLFEFIVCPFSAVFVFFLLFLFEVWTPEWCSLDDDVIQKGNVWCLIFSPSTRLKADHAFLLSKLIHNDRTLCNPTTFCLIIHIHVILLHLHFSVLCFIFLLSGTQGCICKNLVTWQSLLAILNFVRGYLSIKIG